MGVPAIGVLNLEAAVHNRDAPKARVAVPEVHIAYYTCAAIVDVHRVAVSLARRLPVPAPPSPFHDLVLELVHFLFRLFPYTRVDYSLSLYLAAPTLGKGLDLEHVLALVPAILVYPFLQHRFYYDPRSLSYLAPSASLLSELLLLSPVFHDQGVALSLFLF